MELSIFASRPREQLVISAKQRVLLNDFVQKLDPAAERTRPETTLVEINNLVKQGIVDLPTECTKSSVRIVEPGCLVKLQDTLHPKQFMLVRYVGEPALVDLYVSTAGISVHTLADDLGRRIKNGLVGTQLTLHHGGTRYTHYRIISIED
jgi:hypothetical protein